MSEPRVGNESAEKEIEGPPVPWLDTPRVQQNPNPGVPVLGEP